MRDVMVTRSPARILRVMRVSKLCAVLSPVGLVLAIAACSASDPPPAAGTEPVERASSAIINGELDTTHQAVVAIVLQQGNEGALCSGTIVKVDPVTHVGWVLTAAHCVAIPPVLVLQSNDFSQEAGTLRYDILDYAADPAYNGQTGSPNDFAMVRILGADASTPTIPLVSAPDGLVVGTPVVSVGYGRTTLIASGPPPMDNTIRRHVAKTLSQVGQEIAYDMRDDGICQGDSGGPVLVTVGGVEHVAGVHSYVQGDCNGTGVSTRVTFGASFISGELAKAVPAEDCALCGKIANSGNSICATASRKCIEDKECGGYYTCLSGGMTQAQCLTQFPKAEGPFNVAANCVCTQACQTECKGTIDCKNAPKCGYKFPAGDCTTCTESACCDEALACASDGTCYVCLKTKDAAAECATNAARKTLATCISTKCNTQCAGTGLTTGAPAASDDAGTDPTGAAPPPSTTTTTTSGCSIAATRRTGSSERPLLLALAALALVVARRKQR